MWSSKTSGIPELTLCTLTPEVRDQGLAIMSGHWPHMIQRKSRPLVNVRVRCTDNYSHPIDKSTPGQNEVICVCAHFSLGRKVLEAEENLTQTSSDVEPAGVRLCHMLALSVHMRPTCTERAESGILWWVKAHVSCANFIKGDWKKVRLAQRPLCYNQRQSAKFQNSIKETKMKSRVLKICRIFWYI